MNSRRRNQPVIIIADADEYERTLLRAMLKLIGFEVLEAWDAPQAVKLAREQSSDLLVIDLTLPRLNRTKLERIRYQSGLPNLPIVAVAAEDANRRPKESGSETAFLEKPIDYEQFYTLLDGFLPGHWTAPKRSKRLPL